MTLCETNGLRCFICTSALLVHCLKITKNPLNSSGLDWIRSVDVLSNCPPPHQLNKTRLDATPLTSTQPIRLRLTWLYVGSGSLQYVSNLHGLYWSLCSINVIQYSCLDCLVFQFIQLTRHTENLFKLRHSGHNGSRQYTTFLLRFGSFWFQTSIRKPVILTDDSCVTCWDNSSS